MPILHHRKKSLWLMKTWNCARMVQDAWRTLELKNSLLCSSAKRGKRKIEVMPIYFWNQGGSFLHLVVIDFWWEKSKRPKENLAQEWHDGVSSDSSFQNDKIDGKMQETTPLPLLCIDISMDNITLHPLLLFFFFFIFFLCFFSWLDLVSWWKTQKKK